MNAWLLVILSVREECSRFSTKSRLSQFEQNKQVSKIRCFICKGVKLLISDLGSNANKFDSNLILARSNKREKTHLNRDERCYVSILRGGPLTG